MAKTTYSPIFALLGLAFALVGCSPDDGGDSSFFVQCSGITIQSPTSEQTGSSGDGENPGSGISNPAAPQSNDGEISFCNVSDGTITVTDNTTNLSNLDTFDVLKAHEGCARITSFPDGSTVYPRAARCVD